MKPESHEFTGVRPFQENDRLAPSLQLDMDLLDSSKMFCFGNLKPGEVLHVHTAEGSVTLGFYPRSRMGAGIAFPAYVIESTLKDLEANESIRIDGTSSGITTMAQVGFIGQFCHLEYSKFPKKELEEADYAYLESLPDDERQQVIELLRVSIEDGKYYREAWDHMWRSTPEVLRAERQLENEEPVSIFD